MAEPEKKFEYAVANDNYPPEVAGTFAEAI